MTDFALRVIELIRNSPEPEEAEQIAHDFIKTINAESTI